MTTPDLRERLALATGAHHLDDERDFDHCVCGNWSDGDPGVMSGWDDHMADVSVAVFADWLRDLALMRDSSWLPSDPFATDDGRGYVGAALDILADKIDPLERS